MSEFQSEFSITNSRVLVMTYSSQGEYRVTIQPGGGSVSRAIEDAVRAITGIPNLIAESVRFRVEDK